ncbi:transcriptional protein SWT1 isoform X1 [Thamnophis elegans]|uniref:transcriptional protein SWT1 isoform X1 n=2 Tax=Thamnophis elegans TaxID=35005 RepID=UPI001377E73C|nr:transcriptional protein SWT1 isoform X1 [Thamnophis elegans]
MSKKHKKKSSQKDDILDKKKPESAEIGNRHAKEQLDQRVSGAGYVKAKMSFDLKHSSTGLEAKISKDSQPINSALIPLEEREKITMQFKATANLGEKSIMEPIVVFSRKEQSGMSGSDPDDKKRRKLSHDLGIINIKEKDKKKDKMESTKFKKVILKRIMEEFKETTRPAESSFLHKKKTLRFNEITPKMNCSKTQHVPDLPFTVTDSKVHMQASKKDTLEKEKRLSLELSSKNGKEVKCTLSYHLAKLPKCWKYKNEEPTPTDSETDICNSRIRGNKFEPVTFHSSWSSKSSCSSLENIENTDVDQEMQIVEDLHAARIEKKMDLPVVQACGELTCMEIDLADDESHISSNIFSGLNTLIVIDTNIMISHLTFIKSLKNANIPGIGRFLLLIPWVVLQELDNLKRGKILANVSQKAIPAVHFIYTCLKNQDPKLWGQSMQLASQKTQSFSTENNDDRVLQCCLQYQNLCPQAEVILLTDDKNLCNKALVSEIKAYSKADLVVAFQEMTPKGTIISEDTANNKWGKDKYPKKTEKSSNHLSEIIFDVEKSLGDVLSSILETELKIAFGDLWIEVVYHKPPWTLANVLECYKKHWMAVFGQFISRSLFSTIEYLYLHLCKGKIIGYSTLRNVLRESKMLLEMFSSRSTYDGFLSRALAQVNKLLKTVEEMESSIGENSKDTLKSNLGNDTCEKMEDVILSEHTQTGDKSPLTEPSAQENRHKEIWSVLENVWNRINVFSFEIFQKVDLNAISQTSNMSSFQEAFMGLQKLMGTVNEILAGIQQVLVPNSSFQDVWALYRFLTNNEVNNSTKFTAEELYDCISQEIYRTRLSVGYGQLIQLEHIVRQRYQSVLLEIKNRGWL